MQRRGKTAYGTQRWLCVACGTSSVRVRPDRRVAQHKQSFLRWIRGMRPLSDVAQELHVSRQTLSKRFTRFLNERPKAPSHDTSDDVLILDATWLGGRSAIALIACTTKWIRMWAFGHTESYDTWHAFVQNLTQPKAVVIDGNNGLKKAILSRWRGILIQRCMAHVIRFSCGKLTQKPRTQAGWELRALVLALPKVHTRRQKRRWIRRFRRWEKKHDVFLKERSYYTRNGKVRWWYTHRSIRAVRSHIKNALPYLFIYVRHPWIPRTSNHIEGGTNARIDELIGRHRGMPLEHRKALVAYFLMLKIEKKPPRKFT